MLMLVTSDNLLQLFFGWEGVGLASYLLIGFWYTKPSACAAAIKAFIVNRVGDFGLVLGVAGLLPRLRQHPVRRDLRPRPEIADTTMHAFGGDFATLDLIGVLLFIGAMGKSAQLGLHTWLPDAMEGPTPGLGADPCRDHGDRRRVPGRTVLAALRVRADGAGDGHLHRRQTAIFAATIGLTQFDIKRVIAYSTCSQLGYMFFACGVGAYDAGIFHLYTHAFFKALLFLGAGSVIHAMSDEQDMRRMGGIWSKVKITYAVMWIGTLALVGFPGFAGFFSKDAILEAA